jgi:methylase of polypeptide subunit release factors
VVTQRAHHRYDDVVDIQGQDVSSHPLVLLGELLQSMNYRFVTVTPLTHQRVNQRRGNEWAHNVTDIFGWSRPFRRNVISPEMFALLHQANALERHGSGWISRVRWSTLGDSLFVHSRFPTGQSDAVFFGPDTYRFAQAIRVQMQKETRSGFRAADIGCGAGAGAILTALARPSAEVVAVDINPRALDFTTINSHLAGTQTVEVMHSDLLHDVDGDFDLIISNPPYLLDAEQRTYRHGGGAYGEALSLDIVNSAVDRLAPGGVLLLYTGVAIIDGQDPFLAAFHPLLKDRPVNYRYREVDPDVFGEELGNPAYHDADRIAAVVLCVSRTRY